MAGEWRDVALEDVADELTVGYVGPMASEYVDGGIPFLRSMNVDPLRINRNDLKFITPGFHQRIRKSRLTPGDVVIVRTGKPGACSVVPDWLSDANCSDLVIVRCGPQLDNRFLAYYVNTVACNHIAAHLVGAVQQHFNVGSARTLRLNLPPLLEQKAIASVLGTLDDLIELNRETNEILEEMARALFKSWFVDFDPVRAKLEGRPPAGMDAATAALFPDHFQDSELGQIPMGWEVKPLAEMIEVVKGRSYRSDELAPSTTALVTLKSFLRGGGYRADGLKSFTGEYKPSQVVRPGDLIVAFTDVTQAAEVIGKPALVRGDGQFQTLVASLDVGIVRTKTEFLPIPFLYCLFLTESFQAHTYAHSSGTTVLHLSKEALPSFPCVVPPKEIARKFGGIAGNIFNLIEENTAESRDLAALRDTLLPKLLSGEVSAPAAESLIAAST